MISINEAIRQMKTSADPFTLEFIRATGSNKGTTKTVRAVYGHMNPSGKRSRPPSASQDRRRSRKSYKTSSKIPLIDVQRRQNCTPFIPLLVKFNDQIIKH